MIKYRIIDHYDVYGNPSEGFNVNDSFELEDLLELPEDPSDEDILEALKDYGYFKRHVTLEDIEFDNVGPETIYVNRILDGYPYCTLVRSED